ncbi:MAG TPA: OpgC domain-containing protein [Xanthobacteraceae bacterium]|jgi:hypothetical protein|nr:OpgC domain-containing protein [Xanthobacteraceae bacterium]
MSQRTSPQASLYGGGRADPNQRAGRDLRLDLFRGLSLLFIFIDHIPNNVLSYVTLHSIAFSDAAEVFVFISGYAAATVYGKALERQGPIAAAGHIYRRAWQLYVAHIFTFVLFAAAICYATLAVQNQTYSEDFGIDNFIDEPQVAIIKALLLQYQPQFLDILPIYMIFLGVFPLVLLLMRRSLPLPLVVSAAIYLLTWRFGWQPHSYPDDETWYFNPLAWQFLFVIGATAGYARYSRQPLPLHGAWLVPLAVAIVAVVAVVSASWTIHSVNESFPALLFQELSPYVEDKSNLAPLRLVSFLALAVTAAHVVGRNAQILRRPLAQLFIRCGQHSLQVFCLGILLSVIGQIVLTSWRGDIPMQLAVDLAGIALMSALAGLLTWYKSSNAAHSDAAVAASGDARGRSMAGTRAPRGDAAPPLQPIEAGSRGAQLPLPAFP